MDDDFTDFKIGIVGLGLIGGSLAKAFKAAGHFVSGFDTAKATVAAALADGAVDEAACEPSGIFACSCIFVALYPEGIIDFIKDNLSNFQKGTVVIDCCGVKAQVCETLFELTCGAPFTYIGGHPMAGTEFSGFSASSSTLFHDASFILTPRENENEELLAELRGLLLNAGFGKVITATPEHHDRMIAFTSQLPHVIACAYVMSPSCPQHEGFSAGSFRDVARVAHINPALWSELFAGNRKALCEEIDVMIEHMQRIRDAAKAGDQNALSALLQEARERKDSV